MSTDRLPESLRIAPRPATPATPDDGPLGPLPRLAGFQARLASRLRRSGLHAEAVGWLFDAAGTEMRAGTPEIFDRPTGLRRAGAVVQFLWPRLDARVGLGLETPLAHALVDRLLGFDRPPEASRLQISPVEWGILTFAAAETLRRLAGTDGPLGSWDLVVDRVSAEPFEVAGLGRVVTVYWPLELGTTTGALRFWLPATLASRWADAPRPAVPTRVPSVPSDLVGSWAARAGVVNLSRGVRTLRTGAVLPLGGGVLRGTALSPDGPVDLTLPVRNPDGAFTIPSTPLPNSGGGRLVVTGPLSYRPTPREPVAVTPAPPAGSPAPDVPVTLVVELGRLNLTLARLADLKPGDVVELGRHSREPIELTSNGRLVARGELVQIDTELGVRVTHVFL